MESSSIPSEQQHRSDASVLNRRTLNHDFRRLAEILRSGMAVLDVGCGTGAITAGIARRAGPSGRVVGVDRDETLLELARAGNDSPNLRFVSGDALSLDFDGEFDIAASARTLQWVSDPARAVIRLAASVKPGGKVIVLDYCHELSRWEPEPPPEFSRFYSAFLAWRTANGWSNRMGDELPSLLRAAGLVDVESRNDDEIVERGEPDFERATAIWVGSIETMGSAMAAAGFWTERDRAEALESYARYVQCDLRRQMLAMRSVVGTFMQPLA